MDNSSFNKSPSYINQIGMAILVLLSATFLVVISTFFPIQIVLMVVVSIIGLLVSFKHPVLPVFLVLLVICDVLPFPKGGRLYPFFICACIFTTMIINFYKGRKLKVQDKAIFLPAILFIVVWIVGAVNGKFINNNYSPYVVNEFQAALAWLICPAIMLSFHQKGMFESIFKTLILMSVLIAIGTIFQNITGISLAGGRVEQLETLGQVSDITRTGITGKLFLLFGLFALVGRVLIEKPIFHKTIFRFILIALMVSALILSFGRALWFGTLLGVLFTAILLGKRQFILVVTLILVIGTSTFAGLNILKPEMATAISDRALSVFNEGKSSSSFGWRITENEYARTVIERNPAFGIGLGGEYKPPLVSSKLFPSQTSYIHNGYMFLALKFGIWAVMLPIILVSFTTYFGLSLLRGHKGPLQQSGIASVVACHWVAAILAYTQPEWSTLSSIAFFASSLALVASLNLISPKKLSSDVNLLI